jgi:hypothetical protein
MFLPLQSSLHALLLHWVVRTPNSLPYLEAAHEQGEFARALPLAAKPSLLDPLQARFSMFATRRLALRPLEVYHILRSTRRSNLCSRRAEVQYRVQYWPLEHTGFVLVFHTTQVTQPARSRFAFKTTKIFSSLHPRTLNLRAVDHPLCAAPIFMGACGV